MFKRIRKKVTTGINSNSAFKKFLLKVYNLFFDIRPYIVGALTRCPAYIFHVLNSTVVAKPGTLGFGGGVFNPGALILDDGSVLLLARSQVVPWFKARGKYRHLYMAGSPVAFIFNPQKACVTSSFVIERVERISDWETFAIEDFRLFEWKGQKMVNHSLITKGYENGFINQKSVSAALSVFDQNRMEIKFLGVPKVDFPLQNFEKNWMYKEYEGRLYLFYGAHPYHVLVLSDSGEWEFTTVIRQEMGPQFTNPGGFGTRVSLSTNPIDYDDQHWFIVIHQFAQKMTGRWYVHWGVLIDRTSLLPVKITSEPLFTGAGARGRVPGYRYISSVLRMEAELLFFAGEGDVFVTVTKKTVQDVEKLWVPIES